MEVPGSSMTTMIVSSGDPRRGRTRRRWPRSGSGRARRCSRRPAASCGPFPSCPQQGSRRPGPAARCPLPRRTSSCPERPRRSARRPPDARGDGDVATRFPSASIVAITSWRIDVDAVVGHRVVGGQHLHGGDRDALAHGDRGQRRPRVVVGRRQQIPGDSLGNPMAVESPKPKSRRYASSRSGPSSLAHEDRADVRRPGQDVGRRPLDRRVMAAVDELLVVDLERHRARSPGSRG